MNSFLITILLVLPFCSFAQDIIAIDSSKTASDTALLVFCGGIENDLPVGESNVFFRDTAGNGYIYAFYRQPSPLLMKKVLIEIYSNGTKTSEGKWFNIKPKWKYTFLKCYFPSRGAYHVLLYDENKKILASGMVTILER